MHNFNLTFAVKDWRRERPGNKVTNSFKIVDPWNVLENVPGINPWNVLKIVPGVDPWNVLENVPGIDPWNVFEIVPGIDPWNVLENASIRSRDRASIQTSRHGRENEERSILHNQLIFVAVGVPPSETTITTQKLWQLDNLGDSSYGCFLETLPFRISLCM